MVATAAAVLGSGSSGRCCGWWERGTALTTRWLLLHAHLQSALSQPLSWVPIGGLLAGRGGAWPGGRCRAKGGGAKGCCSEALAFGAVGEGEKARVAVQEQGG
jgi:hypothetical protein